MQRDSMENYYSDYITGDLDAALQVSVENHINASPEANAEIDALRRTLATLDAMPSAEPPAWFHDNLMNRLDMEVAKETEAAQKKSGWTWRILLQPRALARGAAALAVLCVVGGVGMQSAGINPLSWLNAGRIRQEALLNAVKAPTAHAEWRPDNDGTAIVHIAVPKDAVSDSINLTYTLESHGSKVNAVRTGVLSGLPEQIITIACETPPAGTLSLKVTASNSSNQKEEKPVAITFAP